MSRSSIGLPYFFFFFSSRRRHTILQVDWSSDVCSSDLREDPRLPGFPAAPAGAARAGQRRRARQDRKSTRLNSSHLVTSYAVFCLKKKTRPCCASLAPTLSSDSHARQLLPSTAP